MKFFFTSVIDKTHKKKGQERVGYMFSIKPRIKIFLINKLKCNDQIKFKVTLMQK